MAAVDWSIAAVPGGLLFLAVLFLGAWVLRRKEHRVVPSTEDAPLWSQEEDGGEGLSAGLIPGRQSVMRVLTGVLRRGDGAVRSAGGRALRKFSAEKGGLPPSQNAKLDSEAAMTMMTAAREGSPSRRLDRSSRSGDLRLDSGSKVESPMVGSMPKNVNYGEVLNPRSLRDQIILQLRNVPMFEDIFGFESLAMIASRCHLHRYYEDDNIVTQGGEGDSMYVIKSGHVVVTQSCNTESVVERQGPAHIEIARLGPHDVFGEMSLLVGDKRSASVTALTFVECLEIPREALRLVLTSHLQQESCKKEFVMRIANIVSERRVELEVNQKQQFSLSLSQDIEKHFDMQSTVELVRTIPLFRPVLDNDELIHLLASRSETARFTEGSTIVRQNDPGDCMYIVKTGQVAVSMKFTHCDTGIDVPDIEVARLGPGDFFGEMTLLVGELRSASVVALEKTDCIKISKHAVLPVLMARADIGIEMAKIITDRKMATGKSQTVIDVQALTHNIGTHYGLEDLITLLTTVPIFRDLVKQEELLRSIAANSSLEMFQASTLVVAYKQVAQSMLIVKEGELEVSIPNGEGEDCQVALLGKGAFFGEMSLLTGSTRSANVRALRDSECLRIPYTALLPVLITWPNFTVGMARIITERRTDIMRTCKANSGSKIASSTGQLGDVATFVSAFSTISLFESLWKNEFLLEVLASKCKLVNFKQGALIIRNRDFCTDPCVYIIKSGQVTVLGEVEPSVKPGTASRRWSINQGDAAAVAPIATLGKGMVFGEMALLTGEPRCASVSAGFSCEIPNREALGDSTCIQIPASALLPLMIIRPQISYHFAEVVSERRQNAGNRAKHLQEGSRFLYDQMDHFFRVDQVLRQHTSMLEKQAMSGMKILVW